MTAPVVSKTVLILANSRKVSGRCIAGVDLGGDGGLVWVRPVSVREHGEVSEYERRYRDGTDPKLLDVVQIPLLEHVPALHQRENWLLDPDYYWGRVRSADLHELEGLTTTSQLWLSDTPDTRFGVNDRVVAAEAETLTDSLRLILVHDLRYRVFAPSADFGNVKRRVLATFTHAGTEYRMYVTDPLVASEYLPRADEFYEVGTAYLTISLAEPYDGFCYKVVAAVIPV